MSVGLYTIFVVSDWLEYLGDSGGFVALIFIFSNSSIEFYNFVLALFYSSIDLNNELQASFRPQIL